MTHVSVCVCMHTGKGVLVCVYAQARARTHTHTHTHIRDYVYGTLIDQAQRPTIEAKETYYRGIRDLLLGTMFTEHSLTKQRERCLYLDKLMYPPPHMTHVSSSSERERCLYLDKLIRVPIWSPHT
jgi:hypothetical protein